MAEQLGRLLLIRIGDGDDPEVFGNLCGIKTRTFNLSANEVETTKPDCNNPGAAVQRTARPGIVNRTFSGAGTFVSGGTQAILMGHVRAATVFNAEVLVPGEGVYAGSWMVSDFEFEGDMEDDLQFSATFSAAGALTFTAEAGNPVNTLLPSIAGIAQVGQTLTAIEGVWGVSATFTYQWKNAGVAIVGATGKTYVPIGGDLGDKISVTVTATNTSGSASATSAATDEVIAA